MTLVCLGMDSKYLLLLPQLVSNQKEYNFLCTKSHFISLLFNQTVSCDGFFGCMHAHRTFQYSDRTHIARMCAICQSTNFTSTCRFIKKDDFKANFALLLSILVTFDVKTRLISNSDHSLRMRNFDLFSKNKSGKFCLLCPTRLKKIESKTARKCS